MRASRSTTRHRTCHPRSSRRTKNHYGSKSRRGTEVAATFYTPLETAKLEGLDPAKYLRDAALADARNEVLLPHDSAH
jgi:transposase